MKCEYCDNIVDSNLSVCPHCGAPLPKVVVVKKVVPTSNERVMDKNKDAKLINYFLYGVIGVGLLLIIILIFLRYR